MLFLDRVTDPTTLTTWAQFERFHRDAFVERITEFVERVGSADGDRRWLVRARVARRQRPRRRRDRGRRRSVHRGHSPRRATGGTRSGSPGLTLPGLANAHSHAFHRALRGRTHDGGGSFWTWREQMYALADAPRPRDATTRLARAVFAEMALAGITCVGEFHYLHHRPDGTPYADPNAMGERCSPPPPTPASASRCSTRCYLHGGIDEPLPEADGPQRRFSDGPRRRVGRPRRSASPTTGPALRIGAAIHSVRAVDPVSMAPSPRLGRRRAMPLHAHVSEQPAENDACLARLRRARPPSCSPQPARSAERFTAVHATHLDDRRHRRCWPTHGATVCMCPTTERDLADGIGPSRGLAADAACRLVARQRLARGHRPVRGGPGGRARRALAHRRARHAPRPPTCSTAGHRRRPPLPRLARRRPIAVGGLADLVTVEPRVVRTARLAGPTLATAVFAASAADVTRGGGRRAAVVRDGVPRVDRRRRPSCRRDRIDAAERPR